MIDLRVRRRDRYSLELKFRHLVSKNEAEVPRTGKAITRFHLFLPYTFNINPQTFKEQDLYQDIKLYIRFDTPHFTIEDLLSEESDVSPLNRLERLVRDGRQPDPNQVIYELKLLGASYKSLLRSQTRKLLSLPGELTRASVEAYGDLLSRLKEAVTRLGELEPDLDRIGCGDSYRLVDEYLSLSVEGYATRVLSWMRDSERTEHESILEEHIRLQHKYRRKHDYPTATREKPEASWLEEYIYRARLLKRYCLSTLFLDIRRRNQATRVEHLLYAIAAGIAMAVATGVSFISAVRLESVSLTLFLVLVGSYMVKDRLKDIMRAVFYRSLGRFFYDRRTVFMDGQMGVRLGVIKERVAFVSQSKINPAVAAIRARGIFEERALNSMPETVIEYTKLLKLRNRVLQRIHTRVQGVADISILDLKQLLRYLTRQRENVGIPGKSGVRLRNADRIYHLNLVLERRVHDETVMQKIRLVVASNGIRRIEPIGTPVEIPQSDVEPQIHS